jgi:polygalacturonase
MTGKAWLTLAATLVATAASAASGPPAQVERARTCAPEAFGAKHDGAADDTAALQKALDACAGGGAVRLGSGTYLSGPLFLHSHETLEVAKGAVLQATSDHARFLQGGGAPLALINAKGGGDIALVGEGVIDGAGQTWWPATRAAKAAGAAEPPRPRLILLSDVDGLVVRGLTLQNSPTFHLVPQRARNVLIENLDIHAPADSPNTDGIDPSGRDMLLQNLTIDTGDDDIAIKSGQDDRDHPGAATANIVIRNSTFRHGHGLSIGSETNGGVKDIVADNITFDGTSTALRIKTARGRGGSVRNVIYRNIRIANVGQAVLITAYYPKIPAEDSAQPIGPKTPDIAGVRLENVRGDTGIRKLGAIIGLPERAARAIVFQDVRLSGDQPLEVRNAQLELVGGALKAQGGEAVARQVGSDVRVRAQ